MGCVTAVTFNQFGDNGMDAATFDSVDGVIVGIRGNRVFALNQFTGAILAQIDLPPVYASGRGCVSYDVGSNSILAAAWNCPQWSIVGGFQDSQRTLYRLTYSAFPSPSFTIVQTWDIVSTFGQGANKAAAIDVGIMAMHPIAIGGNIYCQLSTRANGTIGGTTAIKFQSTNATIFTVGNGGTGPSYGNIVYGSISTKDNAIMPDPNGGPQVVMLDFTDNTANTFNITAATMIRAVGFAASQQTVYTTDNAQFIYSYSNTGTPLATLNTGRSTFTGLTIRQNPLSGVLYIPGGSDNSVILVDPSAGGGIGAITETALGFDRPVDIVFTGTPIGTSSWAVQDGALPVKLIT